MQSAIGKEILAGTETGTGLLLFGRNRINILQSWPGLAGFLTGFDISSSVVLSVTISCNLNINEYFCNRERNLKNNFQNWN